MISRVADHCFWFGRYLERAESTARVLQVTGGLSLDAELTAQQCWQPLVITAGEQARFAELCGDGASADGEAVQRYLTFSEEAGVSLLRAVGAARENARSIREVISLEAWESINELHLWLSSPGARDDFAEHRYGFFRRVRREIQLCQGLLRGTMLHDEPLDFIWLGVLIERLGQTARILDVQYHAFANASAREDAPVVEVALWLSLLRACYGFEPFMKIHHGPVTGPAVARFLIFEGRFPRSVRHCLGSALELLWKIRPRTERDLPALRALARLRALEAWLRDQEAQDLDGSVTHDVLTQIVDETHGACDEIAKDLFGA